MNAIGIVLQALGFACPIIHKHLTTISMPQIVHEDEEIMLISYAASTPAVYSALDSAGLLPSGLIRVPGPWSPGSSPWGNMLCLVADMKIEIEGGGNQDQE